jgi:hypothetical protein
LVIEVQRTAVPELRSHLLRKVSTSVSGFSKDEVVLQVQFIYFSINMRNFFPNRSAKLLYLLLACGERADTLYFANGAGDSMRGSISARVAAL